MISLLDSKVMDSNSEALGISTEELMTNAGSAIAEILRARFPGKRIAFVCGTGNNGGDGFAAAAELGDEGVAVFLLRPAKDIRSKQSIKQLQKVTCPVKEFFSESAMERFDVIVDCALGTGTIGPIKDPYRNYIETVNRFEGTVISADIPSGLGSDLAVVPDITVTFHDIKPGMTPETSGEIITANIGIPEDAYLKTGPGDMLRYPIPSGNSHKGCNGRLLIIGGGPYFGAPAMSGMAAMRIGADLVRIAAPSSVSRIIASFSPVLMITELSGDLLKATHVNALLELSADFDAVLIGPGLGNDDDTRNAVRSFISSCRTPMVLDADALSSADAACLSSNTPRVLTPHRSEFAGLGGKLDGILVDNADTLASELNSVILLKGAEDIITDGRRHRFNETGTPAMTSAGTGDVLAGIVAGLLSKGMTAFDAACLGAYICGKAGEYAFDKRSYGLTATDVIDRISKVLLEGLRK